jgi:glucose-6-phosphate isomerase
MSDALQYDPSAALRLLPEGSVQALTSQLDAARAETLADIDLLESGGEIPSEKQPLDAAFINLPRQLLDELDSAGDDSEIARIERSAQLLRDEVDRVVLLGIGGSYMAARALFEGLCHPWHNALSREKRSGVPRVYFEGNNVDSDAQRDLLEMLPRTPSCPRELTDRWAAVVISKSGGTLETAISFRQFRKALEDYYGAGSEEVRKFIVPVTGEVGKLRDITNEQHYNAHFPIPDGVGGRFSIFTAVGLLPVAVLGLDIRKLLRGAADMTDRFRTAAAGDNPVLDYTAICHASENAGANIRVLSTWGNKLEATGLWYDQLLSESLGKHEKGATPITVVNTRDLHSRGQQHQEGRRDKLITNVIVGNLSKEPLGIPTFESDLDDLNRFASKSVADVLSAAILGTNKAYADEKRPTADLILPQLTEHTLGQFFQMLMLATVVEGRMIGINPYGQLGVEAYKTNTMSILAE